MSVGSQLDHAHAVCRGVTRRAARNFYYAFLVLPREKRDALCAVYAFMRQCDDICDDPALPLAERRARLEAWREELHQVLAGGSTDDPVLFALADAQRRFQIPPELFDKLVEGTAMDLPPAEAGPGAILTFADFDELYHYCYHVASVVGLVAIRIFGYRDPKAEPLAERCGIAFQLTNIIRDVGEDAARGRIYLPLSELQRFDVKAHELTSRAYSPRFTELMRFQARRALATYDEALALLPAQDRRAQKPGLMMASIYRTLLREIERDGFQVLHQRVSLTPLRKFWLAWKVQALGRL